MLVPFMLVVPQLLVVTLLSLLAEMMFDPGAVRSGLIRLHLGRQFIGQLCQGSQLRRGHLSAFLLDIVVDGYRLSRRTRDMQHLCPMDHRFPV
jgi:hypothetical protein